DAAAASCEATAAQLRPLLGDWLFAEGTLDLPALVLQRLQQRNHTLALAYSDDSKQQLLSVPAALLQAHGAVSEPVASAMAAGARKHFAADIAIATTG